MKKTREQKGITLIALIITIIVLLILALVTINAVRGDGIISRAQEAKNEYSESQAKEKVALALEDWRILKHTQADANLGNFLTEKFGADNVTANEDGTYTVTVDGYGVIVDSEGNVTGIASNNNDTGNEEENNPGDENNEIPSITLDKTEINVGIEANKTATLDLKATLVNASGDLTWVSSDDSIAEISGDDNDTKTITLKKEGNATITVSYGEYNATCNIIITKLVLQIGDKVAYDEGSGKTSSIDSSFVMKDMEWRILDIEEDGTIELISTQPTDSTLTLVGQNGWLNAEEKLDTLCNDLYANGTGITARSLKVEDIDKLASYDPTTGSNYGSRWQYQYSTETGYMQYRKSTDEGTTWGDWTNITSSSYQTFKEPGKETISSSNYQDSDGNQRIADLTYTYYNYDISSRVTQTTSDNISMASLITQGLNDTNDATSGTNVTQWLSSCCVACYSNFVDFSVFDVRDGRVDYYWYLWNSRGTQRSVMYAVRPVVSLPSSVTLTNVDGVWQIN